MTKRLVLFAKPPLGGTAKTRLAADIGDAAASAVAEALLTDTIALCESIAGPELTLAYTDDRDYFAGLVTSRWRLLRQEGPGLGERLDSALAALALAPDDATVFVGMDAPHVPPEYLLQAFDVLRESDTALGPCDDGGYYLLGVRGTWPRGALGGVRWSTEDACDDTRAAFTNSELRCATLPRWYDVDDVESLRRLAIDLRSMAADALPAVRETLQVVAKRAIC